MSSFLSLAVVFAFQLHGVKTWATKQNISLSCAQHCRTVIYTSLTSPHWTSRFRFRWFFYIILCTPGDKASSFILGLFAGMIDCSWLVARLYREVSLVNLCPVVNWAVVTVAKSPVIKVFAVALSFSVNMLLWWSWSPRGWSNKFKLAKNVLSLASAWAFKYKSLRRCSQPRTQHRKTLFCHWNALFAALYSTMADFFWSNSKRVSGFLSLTAVFEIPVSSHFRQHALLAQKIRCGLDQLFWSYYPVLHSFS